MSLSVIIPSKNADNLWPCIQAVRANEPDVKIIVVDDGVKWTPDMAEEVDGCEPGKKPFVYARNINIGIRAAGEDDVILLNDDALLKTPGGFTAMQEAWRRTEGYGVIASTCNNVGNCNQMPRSEKFATGVFRDDPRTLCFVCVFIPRKTINLLDFSMDDWCTGGLLDERYTGYGMDDDDYCLQVRKIGLKLGIYDGCYVDHGSLTSSYRGGPQTGGDFRPNLKRFIEKWGVDNWGRTRDQSEFKSLWP